MYPFLNLCLVYLYFSTKIDYELVLSSSPAHYLVNNLFYFISNTTNNRTPVSFSAANAEVNGNTNNEVCS